MKKRIHLLPLFTVLLSTSAFAHTVAYPHGHPHAPTTTWADVLITGGVIAVMAFGAAALFRWKGKSGRIRQKAR
jgi:hypothetical protein